ncbi:uncharacterized protein EAF01_008897 [Botrytis porri]|uniref:uncharacterized protein n=1 Tax=Botrytis porri TaxID=87229 RepID=UPI0018FF6CCE|nr:uncharacterized protein EAF01_008897 [Botrytis porri]KAF7897931.1 hypothetical protein EAF01_008897 [Botrytis porri]
MSGIISTRSIRLESSDNSAGPLGAQALACLAVMSEVGIINFQPNLDRIAWFKVREVENQTPNSSEKYKISLRFQFCRMIFEGNQDDEVKNVHFPEESILRILLCWKRMAAAWNLQQAPYFVIIAWWCVF